MPKRMSASEDDPTSAGWRARGAGWERVERRAAGALARLEAGAADEEGASFVAVMLGTAADLVEGREVAAPLSVAEQEVWESIGARLEAADVVRKSSTHTLAAFGDLFARSLRGIAAMAEALGVDRSRISQRLKPPPSLYAFRGPDDEYYFPRWQVHAAATLPGLKTVLREIRPDAHPLSVDHWFRTPNVDLVIGDQPVSPVEWLATGGDAEVAAGLASDV